MMPNDDRYAKFSLVKEMLAAPEIVRGFQPDQMAEVATDIAAVGRLLMTGEGSSRLFPAKNVIAHARRQGWPLQLHTEGGRQSQEYKLDDWAVFGLSNSGRTAEVIELFSQLKQQGHQHLYSVSASPNSMLESLACQGFVLRCGKEEAVAATKSVIEQALFYRSLLEHTAGMPTLGKRLQELATAMEQALTVPVDTELIERIAAADRIYWAGRNDGVAEELTLKTNEITRKPADYLEGTYAVHGIEEVMTKQDVVIWVDPFEVSEPKIQSTLVEGVGLSVIAVSARQTRFPTIPIPGVGDLDGYVQMAAGWNILVEVGLHLNVNLDKPVRARKVGNEYESKASD